MGGGRGMRGVGAVDMWCTGVVQNRESTDFRSPEVGITGPLYHS